ncbi:MAG TPA: MAPEG family protein [Xanthobacteraceae bacterium]|nr:MAPEG family protein [Xanthobacteraceae bacterium]
MMVQGILIPVFVLVAITFVFLFWAGGLRAGNLRSGAVKADTIALREPNWPKRTTQIGCAYANTLELPILFYVLVALLIETKHADLLFVILAWLFVLARIFHAGIHITGNDPQRRGPVFGLGALVLAVMWIVFAVEILTYT